MDPLREPRAYNNSILLMVTMPYLLLGGLGFLIYRSIRNGSKNQHPDSDASSEISKDEEREG